MKLLKNKTFAWIFTAVIILCCAFFGVTKYSVLLPDSSFSAAYAVDKVSGILSINTQQYINYGSAEFFRDYGAQLAVVVVPDTGMLSTEQFATTQFNQWGVGSAEEDNGVMLLMVIENRSDPSENDWYVVLGNGIYDDFMDFANDIQFAIENSFAKGDYDTAAYNFAALMFSLFDEYYGGSALGGLYTQRGGEGIGWIILLVILIIIVLIIISRSGKNSKKKLKKSPTTYGTGSFGGGSGDVIVLDNGRHTVRVPDPQRRSSGSSWGSSGRSDGFGGYSSAGRSGGFSGHGSPGRSGGGLSRGGSLGGSGRSGGGFSRGGSLGGGGRSGGGFGRR